jgi:hypothetical protein
LNLGTIEALGSAVDEVRAGAATVFVVLDATRLRHIPLASAQAITRLEPRWRDRGVVAMWVGLNPYLANLLTLACGNLQSVPALADWQTVERLVAEVKDRPAPVARGRLVTSSALVH